MCRKDLTGPGGGGWKLVHFRLAFPEKPTWNLKNLALFRRSLGSLKWIRSAAVEWLCGAQDPDGFRHERLQDFEAFHSTEGTKPS